MVKLSLCMIVRDESDVLGNCLQSVQGIVDEIVIVDTGSSDNTIQVAQGFGATCFTMPWANDFASARNVSLQRAQGDYILVLDADEVLTDKGRQGLKRCLSEFPHADAFFVHILNRTDKDGVIEFEESLNVRVFRNNPQYRFSGALHEQVAESILHANPPGTIYDSSIEIEHSGYMKEIVEQKKKRERNLQIALREVECHPHDAFRAFNLGVEYIRLEQYDLALEAFSRVYDWAPREALWASRFYKIYIVTLMQAGRWDQAKAILQTVTPWYPDYTDLYYLNGVLHIQMKEWTLALRQFAKCIEMGDPPIPPYTIEKGISSYRAYFALGQAFQSLGMVTQAAVAYRLSFEQNPSLTDSFFRLAHLLLTDDNGPDTIDYLSEIALSGGASKDSLLGIALVKSDQFMLAESYLEQAERNEDVSTHLAIAYACLGKREKLREILIREKASDIISTVRTYLLNRGQLILDAGLLRFPNSETLLALREELKRCRP